MAGPFEKDFGYLLLFLDRIAQAADSLSNPAASRELRELVSGEKTRWIRIRELLENASKVTDHTPRASPTHAAADAPAPSPPAGRPAPPQFTVGSLKSRGRS